MTDSSQNDNLQSALKLASMGFRIFPLHGIVDENCTCGGKGNCTPGKHPVIKGWGQSATIDPVQITKWFENKPFNIGLVTGKSSGIWVLDVDNDKGGETTLDELIEQHGMLTETLRVKTGNGIHYYFKYPDESEISNSAKKLGEGLDVRGGGGYVVAPGSTHHTGVVYEWIDNPDVTTVKKAPRWLLQKIIAKQKEKFTAPKLNDQQFDRTFYEILEGKRGQTLFSTFSCHLRDKNISKEIVKYICFAVNACYCKPPLEDEKILSIVDSAFKYPKRPSRFRRISDSAQLIHDLLESRSEELQEEWMSCTIGEIASQLGLSHEGVRKCIDQLEEFGYLKVQRYPGKTSRYKVLPIKNDNSSSDLTPQQPPNAVQ